MSAHRDDEFSDDPWNYDWDSARWVFIETNIKSRPAIIGFVDEDEGIRVYLLCPTIRTKEGKWVDSWTWREEIGPLPQLPGGHEFFGEVVVYKPSIKKIRELRDDDAPSFGRCWRCGTRIERGRFCSPACEAGWRFLGLDSEM